MTIAHRLPARNKYKCDVCGKIDFWNDNWSRYSSLALDDTCPGDAPCACNEECGKEMMERIKDGRFVLPKLRSDPGGFYISTEKVGY